MQLLSATNAPAHVRVTYEEKDGQQRDVMGASSKGASCPIVRSPRKGYE